MAAEGRGVMYDVKEIKERYYEAVKEARRVGAQYGDGEKEWLIEEVERLQTWVNDLQSGMYINCVYCGHRYGPSPETPVAMADVLKEHIEKCPKHPMSALQAENEFMRNTLEEFRAGVARDVANKAFKDSLTPTK